MNPSLAASVLYYITIPYLKLYILTVIGANDVKFISVDIQKIDLSIYIYIYIYIYVWYRKFYTCRNEALFYEHKKMTFSHTSSSCLDDNITPRRKVIKWYKWGLGYLNELVCNNS